MAITNPTTRFFIAISSFLFFSGRATLTASAANPDALRDLPWKSENRQSLRLQAGLFIISG
jgi:hypothetical protein